MHKKSTDGIVSNAETYQKFRDYLESACGILLGENKQFLVESRLNRILKAENLTDLSKLVDRLQQNPYSGLKQVIVDAMTTNETMWMRDVHPFNWMRTQLLRDVAKYNQSIGRYDIKIWSAACSSGQEPYSLSMIIEEAKKSGLIPSSFNVKIVATDISKGILEIAQSGVYDKRSLSRGLPDDYLIRYFQPMGAGCYQINKEIQKRIEFKLLNLKENFSMLGKFDIVFCRNVLIYFSADLKLDILSRIHAQINPDGHLFLGGSESLNGLQDKYEMKKYSPGIVYKKKPSNLGRESKAS